MKLVKIILLLCWGCVAWLGCGKTYQSISADSLGTQLSGYEGQRISILGVPDAPHHGDFLPPMPYNKGQWRIVINGVSCTETVNFENQPRIRSMLQMAAFARKENRPITVSGVVKEGQLDIEHFEGIRTDTAWHKNKNLYYSYAAYYEWSPFAYIPNARVPQNFKDAVAPSADHSEDLGLMRNVYYFRVSESWRRLPNLRLCAISKTISYLDRKIGRIFNRIVIPTF